ncbi:hypothetical protein HNY73_012887 [Argiope bruennichi]|uniref:Uncharacterized protein n=1 Tax=Argiope bruennichi TaxID=94029 RepID=A0A8T0EWC5_ARGBR|nr:hypothetical protein HNY73_012887 [Argiope bruennichi]
MKNVLKLRALPLCRGINIHQHFGNVKARTSGQFASHQRNVCGTWPQKMRKKRRTLFAIVPVRIRLEAFKQSSAQPLEEIVAGSLHGNAGDPLPNILLGENCHPRKIFPYFLYTDV